MIGGVFGLLLYSSSKCASIPYCLLSAVPFMYSAERGLCQSEGSGGVSAMSRGISHLSKQIRNFIFVFFYFFRHLNQFFSRMSEQQCCMHHALLILIQHHQLHSTLSLFLFHFHSFSFSIFLNFLLPFLFLPFLFFHLSLLISYFVLFSLLSFLSPTPTHPFFKILSFYILHFLISF